MKTSWLRVFSFLGAIFVFQSAVRATDTNPPPRLTVDLRDGSRVVGESVEKNFRFHSALLGNLKLDVKDIRSVECVSTNLAKLTTTSGDNLVVSFLDSEFAVKTSFGKVELPANFIRKFTVSASLAAGAYPPGLVALWKGADNGKDSAENNDAILTDVSLVDSEMGQAFSFNGLSSSIKIPASPSLDVSAGEGFTLMAWVKPSAVDGVRPLIQWSDSYPLNLWIGIRPSENGVLRGDVTDNAGNHFVASHPGTLVADVFQHIAFTYDKTSGSGTLYLNGIIVAQRQIGSGLIAKTKGDIWFSQRNDRPGDWSTGRMFSGLMDEIAIYNRALSASEIQSICAEQNHGEPLTLPAPSDGWFEEWMR